MGGDFSRTSVDPTKSYVGVLMQQGRVQLDADWNEELALRLRRTQIETRDVIGGSGTPKGLDGFKITQTPDGADLFIHPGRYYLDGMLCEIVLERVGASIQFWPATPSRQASYVVVLQSTWLDGARLMAGDWVEIDAPGQPASVTARLTSVVDPNTLLLEPNPAAALDPFVNADGTGLRRAPTYLTQPFYPSPDRSLGAGSPPKPSGSPPAVGLTLADGAYLVYLEAWQREVNALEDPHLREVALGEADTAIRLQTVWQVRLLNVKAKSGTDPCDASFPEWDQLLASFATTGEMNARSSPQQPVSNPCCMLPPGAGFQGLQNQLYRIEVFTAGDEISARIVWSRDNAMVETAVVSVDASHPNVITVSDLGKDDLHQFAVNDWVELVDRDGEFRGAPRFLARIVTPAPDPVAKTITLSAPTPDPGKINNPGGDNFRLRRWDMSGATVSATGIPITTGWMDIEAGIQVEFSKGFFAPGAYWLIPARIATADIEWPPFQIPNAEPVPQPPRGTPRSFCRIGSILVESGKWKLGDCRQLFPPLTHICADDVCYHSGCEALKAETTVQGALDELCELAKLRFHKKMLHGWGIVCGLQVQCAGGGNGVNVLSGYAIDCEGNDILLEATSFDVIAAITTPSGAADGNYSLILDGQVKGHLRVAPYSAPPETVWQALQGTFWPRYYDRYLAPLYKYLQGLSGSPPPVSELDKLVSSLTNLFASYNDPVNGQKVYISPQEHQVLNKIYQEIVKLLYDDTFCAFKSGMRPMPNYPETIAEMSSIFAVGANRRIRLDPEGTQACVVADADTVGIYSLAGETPALTRLLTLPATGGVAPVVQDALFWDEGKSLIVIATAGADSVVAAISLAPDALWSRATLAGVSLLSLANPKAGVYAVGAGKGLYHITPPADQAPIAVAPVVGAQFVAVGHLVMGGADDVVFATANSAADSSKFDRILEITPTADRATVKTRLMPVVDNHSFLGTLQDDIAVSSLAGFHIYVTCQTAGVTNKTLAVFFSDTEEGDGVWHTDALAENTAIRFSENPRQHVMLMSYAGSSHFDAIAVVREPTIAVTRDYYAAEVNPLAMATDDPGKFTYVLNGEADTITKIPTSESPWNAEKYAILLRYRNAVLAAYWDLVDAILQYLKDGFCDTLLVDCPSCAGDETLYLAGVTVRGGKVYNVCNFSQRKYVRSFPTVEYWLSVIPVFPILGWIVRQLCCEIITDTFAGSEKAVADAKNRVLGPSVNLSVRRAATRLAQFPPLLNSNLTPQIVAGGNFALDYVTSLFRPAAATSGVTVTVGQNAQALAQQLAAANVLTQTVPYDPTRLGLNLTRSALAPVQLQPGAAAVLVVDASGNVRYALQASDQIQVVENEVAAVRLQQSAAAAVLESAAGLKDQVAALTTQLAELKQSQATELAARDAKLAALMETTQNMQLQLHGLQRPAPPVPPSG